MGKLIENPAFISQKTVSFISEKIYSFSDENPSAFSSGQAGMKSWGENENQRKAPFSKKLQLFQGVLRKAGSFSLFQQKLIEKADGKADLKASFYSPEKGQRF